MTARFDSIENLDQDLERNWIRRDCIFRGQSREWPLIPKIGRSAILDRESEIVERFKCRYRTIYQGPADHSDFRIHPDAFYEWDWLALAQHYGLPTRLLDWSAEVEVALHFAVADQENDDCDGAIYIFQDPTAIARRAPLDGVKNVRRYRAYRHSHFTDLRVKRQKGELTWQPDSTRDLFEQLGHDPRQKWERIVVPKELKADIRSVLHKKDITHSFLFPGLDGVCAEIRSDFGM